MIYRVLITLATVPPYPRGYLGPLPFSEEVLSRLLERGIISKARFPPLDFFPEWEEWSQKMKEVNIAPEELLTGDPLELANRLSCSPDDIEARREALRKILSI